MQEPAYKQLVRRLIETEAAAYCIDCLGYLWGKRAEARDVTRQLTGTAPSNIYRSSRSHQTDAQQIFEQPDSTVDVGALAIGRTMIPSDYQSKPVEAEVYVEASMVSENTPAVEQIGLTDSRHHSNSMVLPTVPQLYNRSSHATTTGLTAQCGYCQTLMKIQTSNLNARARHHVWRLSLFLCERHPRHLRALMELLFLPGTSLLQKHQTQLQPRPTALRRKIRAGPPRTSTVSVSRLRLLHHVLRIASSVVNSTLILRCPLSK